MCGKEVGANEIVGMYTRLMKQLRLDMQSVMGRQESLLCEKCQTEVSTKIDTMKNEYNQPARLDKISPFVGSGQQDKKREGDIVGV